MVIKYLGTSGPQSFGYKWTIWLRVCLGTSWLWQYQNICPFITGRPGVLKYVLIVLLFFFYIIVINQLMKTHWHPYYVPYFDVSLSSLIDAFMTQSMMCITMCTLFWCLFQFLGRCLCDLCDLHHYVPTPIHLLPHSQCRLSQVVQNSDRIQLTIFKVIVHAF